MLIRAATQVDVPPIGALWNAMIRDTTATFTTQEKNNSDLTELLNMRRDSFLVACDNGTFAGFITWGSFRSGPGYLHTAEHSIMAKVHGNGIGRALMTAAIEKARTQGIHAMIAAIGGENTAAIAFHNRLGFAKTGHIPQVGRKMGRWHDLILMSRILSAP